MPSTQPDRSSAVSDAGGLALFAELSAVIIAAGVDEPMVLVRPGAPVDTLPAGPLQSEHRTLEAGLRAWVEQQTDLHLGYVEQLYTFGDADRIDMPARGSRSLSVAYLALVRALRASARSGARWQNVYTYLPWEDWRDGRPAVLETIEAYLKAWAAKGSAETSTLREKRAALAFGLGTDSWSDELVLDRYELLYEAGFVREARRDGEPSPLLPVIDHPMGLDHRRILATALGRLRGKIKYRPVIFELMPESFTLLDLQRTVEGLSGVRLHKQNFRRLVETQGLVEETGELQTDTGGRPARLVRFRREVLLERPSPGLRLSSTKRPPI